MAIEVTPSGQACGASIRGVDLTSPLSAEEIAEIRAAWLEHHVVAFPDQAMNDDDLERYTLCFGAFGEDPFIAPIEGREHVIAVHRAADETASIFADAFHTDWSFQERPPSGTCLFGIEIPPKGGDTLFINQHKALREMPAELRAKVEGRRAVHSAGVAYAPAGIYGDSDADSVRAMDIRVSKEAEATHVHPLVRRHEETGEDALFGCIGYIGGLEGMDDQAARDLLLEVYRWQSRPEFQYRHQWQKDMLLMWDNRSVLHQATGGYDGHERLLHRTTIAAYDPTRART